MNVHWKKMCLSAQWVPRTHEKNIRFQMNSIISQNKREFHNELTMRRNTFCCSLSCCLYSFRLPLTECISNFQCDSDRQRVSRRSIIYYLTFKVCIRKYSENEYSEYFGVPFAWACYRYTRNDCNGRNGFIQYGHWTSNAFTIPSWIQWIVSNGSSPQQFHKIGSAIDSKRLGAEIHNATVPGHRLWFQWCRCACS